MSDVAGELELVGDPLQPVGAGGARVGYARVSTADQNLRRQIDALNSAGCIRVFEEKLFGRNAERPQLWACLDYLREGDTLVVPDLARLGRSLAAPSRRSPWTVVPGDEPATTLRRPCDDQQCDA
jgi:hypothetical protein